MTTLLDAVAFAGGVVVVGFLFGLGLFAALRVGSWVETRLDR